jgi:hypothetical protein
MIVAIWLPASSHALLEQLKLIHYVHGGDDCDAQGSHEHNSENHDAADGKCSVAATGVSVRVAKAAATPLLLLALALEWNPEFHRNLRSGGQPPSITAPPQLSHCWQFVFRAASPPRAPSSAS